MLSSHPRAAGCAYRCFVGRHFRCYGQAGEEAAEEAAARGGGGGCEGRSFSRGASKINAVELDGGFRVRLQCRPRTHASTALACARAVTEEGAPSIMLLELFHSKTTTASYAVGDAEVSPQSALTPLAV